MIDARHVDLAIVGLLLPGSLRGDDVATCASERNAKVICIISGALASDTRGRDTVHAHSFRKPFRLDALMTAIAKTFDGQKPATRWGDPLVRPCRECNARGRRWCR